MELTKCKLGELITQRREKSDGTPLPICGVSKDGLIPPKQIDADTSIYNVFYRDDFIFNPARMELNSIAINDKYDRAICSSLYEVFYVHRTDLLLPHYLKLIVKQKWFTRYCEFLGQGSAREYCRFNNISEIEIEFPSVEEQQKIVEHYTALQNRIAIKKQINDNLEAQAEAYFHSTFIESAGLDITNISKLNDDNLPEGWKFATVGDYCIDNIANLSKTDKYKTILYLDTGSITENYIEQLQELHLDTDEIPSRAKRKASNGDIVYSTVRPNLRHYGLLTNPPENLIVSTGFAVLHNNGKGVSNELLYMWLTKDFILEYLQAIAENSVSTYPSLNVSDLMNVRIVIPDTVTLEKANRILSSIFNAIAENNRSISLLEESKPLVLSKLMSSR